MSFPVTEHIAKREHSVILAEDHHTPPISSKSFSKVIENYRCLTSNHCIPAACSLTLYPTSSHQTSPFREIVPHYIYN